MLNNSSPLPFSKNLVKFQIGKENITFNNKTPSIYEEDRNIYNSRNNKPKISENDDIIPRIIISNNKEYGNSNNKNKNKKEEIENMSNNNYYSINANNSLFNEQQSESAVIRDNFNTSPKINSCKMSISELNNNNNIENDYYNDYSEKNELNNNNDNDNRNIEIGDDDNIEEKYNKDQENYKNENEEIFKEFINENNNKNIISQKENEYYLFDINNTINNSNNDNDNDIEKFNNNQKLNSDKNNKRNFFSKILDIEILIDTKEVYFKPWSQLIKNIYNKCESNNDSIQLISLGSQHSLCLSNKGKLYSFGWNNYYQCGKYMKNQIYTNNNNNLKNMQIEKNENIYEIKIGKKINDISAGEDHSLILTEDGKIYGFGLNNNGQLCYDPNKHKTIKKPSLIKSFRKCVTTNIQCTNNISFILNNKGESFICPWEDKQKHMHYIPFKLFFPYKPKISTISCGDNFSIFLSEKGNVYSMGSYNKYGQLGLGDTNIQLSPKIIPFFRNNKIKITQISCGYCHVIALSEKGNAYSWGFGGEGQLGLGDDIYMSFTPKLIKFFKEKEIMIVQVSSGFHSSYFLEEKNNIYICGTNGKDCNKDYIPKIIEYKIKYNDLIKYPCWTCRILNCWNRSISVFYAIFLDCHFINKDDEEVNKVLTLISKKWVHQSFSSSIMQGIYSMNF